MRIIRPDARLIQPFTYEQQHLPIDKPVILYVRQSTDGQVKHNKQSTILQDEQLARRLAVMGFTDIIKIDTDQGKSGQKRRDERKGLDQLYRLVEHGEAGAVAAFSPSRLYRDLTRVACTEFIRMCEEYGIVVITWQRIYWPNSRQDMDALIDKFAEAARFIDEEIHGKLLPAKLQAIEESISYGGGSVPFGYLVATTEDRKCFVIYEPHARLIKWLFKRFRALGGSLSRLARELRDTNFMFPAFSGVEKIPHVALRFKEAGYPLRTRDALISILTNVAYIGWYMFNGVIISKTAHDAIVDMDDFLYAFNRLSPVTLDGEVNENKPKMDKRQHITHALLNGILQNDGNPVYVMAHHHLYTAKHRVDNWDSTVLAVPVKLVDKAFSGALLSVLVALEQRHQQGLQDSLHEQLTALQQEKTEEVISLDTTLANINRAIHGWELDKQSCRDTGNKSGLDEANLQLKRLYDTKDALTAKAQRAQTEQKELAECRSLHQQAVQQWSSLDFNKQQRFVKLLVSSANITEASPHVLRLDITLRHPLNATMTGYIHRRYGGRASWTPEEIATLKKVYPHADRLAILEMLPTRSWHVIIDKAGELGLQRMTYLNSSGIDEMLSYADAVLMDELGLKRGMALWQLDGEIGLAYQDALTPD